MSDGPVSHDLLARLLARHSASLVLFARQWCDVPEDAVQEAFVRLSAEARMPDLAAAWLFRVTRNVAISRGRAARRRRDHERAAASEAAAWFEPRADDAIDARTAAAAIEWLSADERETVVARIWGALSFEEIGQVTGVSTSTAHRRYAEGLASLRRLLEPTPAATTMHPDAKVDETKRR